VITTKKTTQPPVTAATATQKSSAQNLIVSWLFVVVSIFVALLA